MRRAVAAALLIVAGCERGAEPPDGPPPIEAPVHDLAHGVPDFTAPDAPLQVPPMPRQCSDVACLPPSCCGGVCIGDAQCCAGTFCSAGGRCVPQSCGSCGEVGCVVDFNACTGACAKPACCLKACGSDADCCPGARCEPDTHGTKRCTPTLCDNCEGLRPICDVDGTCGVTCRPPATCGTACMVDGDCGANNFCRMFHGGQKLCVPAAFSAACDKCGPKGCLFHPDQCSVECPTSPDGGAGDGGSSDGGSGDGGVASDGGALDASAAIDAAAPTDAGLDANLPDASFADGPAGEAGSACAGCCGACATDRDCCPGQICRTDGKGQLTCAPASCAACPYGCRFSCI